MSIDGINDRTARNSYASDISHSASATDPQPVTFDDIMSETSSNKFLRLEARDEYGRPLSPLTADNMEALSKSVAQKLKVAFTNTGLADNPPINIKVENGQIKVTGRRDDLGTIEELLNNDPDLKLEIEKLS